MVDANTRKLGAVGQVDAVGADDWPTWAKRVVSAVIAAHVVAVLAGALAAPPSSPLEQAAASLFSPYYQLIDQGYAYRYYAPEPGPTPVVTARVRYDDGRPEEAVRLPQRGIRPRLRYQRQLALANHLTDDWRAAKQETGDGSKSAYARSYARHIAKGRPGSVAITLYSQSHLIPDPARVREALEEGKAVDMDAEEFFTVPERIGEFPCDGF